MFFARTHFLACEDVAGGSQQSGGKRFFHEIRWPVRWVPAVRGSIHFFVRNKDALPCVQRYSWWVRAVSGGNIFFAKYRGPSGGSQMSGGGIIILRVIRRHFLECGRGPSCQRLHAQYSSDGSRSLTILTTPRREHHGGGRRRGLGRGRRGSGCPRGEEYEGSLVRLRCRRRRITGCVGEWRDGLASSRSSRGW